jgi:hypothetical protein
VALDAAFVITFSEPVAAATATVANFTWTQGATPVPFTVSSVSGAVVTLTPTSALSPLAPYAVTIGTGVTDVAGNRLAAAVTVGFTTRDPTAPTLTGSDPADGATGIARNKVVTLTFSEAIAGGSVTASTVTWTVGGTPVPHTRATVGSTVTLSPTATLANGSLQTVTVTTGVTDLSGNPLAVQEVVTFTTLDNVAPTIVGTTPANLATGVSRSPVITVTFSEPISAGTATSTNFKLSADDFVTTVPCDVLPVGSAVTMTPTVPLANKALYKFRVETGAADASGNTLAAQATYSFTTADTVAPVVLSTVPAANATRVSRSAPVAITFDEAILAASVTATTVTWKQGGVDVPHTRSVTGATVTLTPTATLGNEALQTVTVTTGVTDLAGNALAADHPFTFMTIDDQAPTFVASSPATGNLAVARATHLVLTFSEPVDPATVTPANLGWTDAASTISWTKVVAGPSVTITPSAPLSNYANQVITVGTGITDLAGNHLAAQAVISLRTVDDVAPVVSGPPTAPAYSLPAAVRFTLPTATDDGTGLSAAGFDIQVNDIPDPAGAVQALAAGATYDFDASNATFFPEGTLLYARVRAWDAAGNTSAWTSWSTGVAIDRSPPSIPLAPVGPGAAQAGTSITFVWEPSSDAVSGVLDYTVQVEDSIAGLLPGEIVSGLTYTFTGGQNGRSYRAHVLATDRLSQASSYGSFSAWTAIDTTLPATPGQPTDGGAFTAANSFDFAWPAVAGAVSYVVQLGTTPGGNDLVAGLDLGSAATSVNFSFADPAAFQGATLYLRVAAVNGAAQQGGWSDSTDGITLDMTAPSAPGTPAPRGATTGPLATFTWTPATDLESGIQSYDVEVFDGTTTYNANVVDPFIDFDASALVGSELEARVRARNGALTLGAWSSWSPLVRVENTPPTVSYMNPGNGQTQQGRNVDVVLVFSEPMDPASVEAALSISWDSGATPAYGLGFYWDASWQRVTVMPDASLPAGLITNVDLLPGGKHVTVTLGTGATDAAGNPLAAAFSSSFDTSDEIPPVLTGLSVAGEPSPISAAAAAASPVVITATFDKPMDPTRGRMRIELPYQNVEESYQQMWIQSASSSGGSTTYTTGSCADIRTGDVVTIRGTNPPSFDVDRAVVTAGGCPFTVAHSSAGSWAGGGQVYYSSHWNGGSVAWTSATTLQLRLPGGERLQPGAEYRVSVNDLSDLDGDSAWADRQLQVRPIPGTDLAPPVLVSQVPLASATGAARAAPIILVFSEPLDVGSLEGAYAVDSAGNPWELNYSSDEMGPIAVFAPRVAPQGGTRVDVHVPGSVADLSGRLLGAPIDFHFDVALATDVGDPVPFETLPGDGVPVDEVYGASVLFADTVSDRIEQLDARSAGMEDVFVSDLDTGLPIRGFRARIESWSPALSIDPPPRGPGFQTGWGGGGFSSATASGGLATIVTSGPHGLRNGWHPEIQIQGVSSGDGCFAGTGVLQTVLDANTFTMTTTCPDGATPASGWANWRYPRSYVLDVAVPETFGGTGIADFEGHPVAPFTFTVAATPAGVNRYPTADSLRDLRLQVTSTPLGRQLGAELRLRDADDDPVTVSLTAKNGTVTFSDAPGSNYFVTQTLFNTRWGNSYRLSVDGPPGPTLPAELNDANFPTSAYYPFEVTMNDGKGGVSVYTVPLWIWRPDAVPLQGHVDDGAVQRDPIPDRPTVVENTTRPTLNWSRVDVANADFQALQYLEVSALTIGNNSNGPSSLFLDKSFTSAPMPIDLEPTLYAWFVNQMKFGQGGSDLQSQGMSLDFSHFLTAGLLYGPGNAVLDARDYDVVRTVRYVSAPPAALGALWSASGKYEIEAAPVGLPPVFVGETMARNDGTTYSATELFADGADGRFMVTTTPTTIPLPMANRGIIGLDGAFFAVAGQDPDSISLEVGTWRNPAITWGSNLSGLQFGFVYFGGSLSALDTISSTEASVGTAVAGPTTITVDGLNSDGNPINVPGPLPYTLGADGLLIMDIDGGVGATGFGYMGGTPASLMGALTSDFNALWDWNLFMVQKHDAPYPADPRTIVQGTYQLVEYTSGEREVHASAGTMEFDGAGIFTYRVKNGGQTMTGYGTYAIDTATGRIQMTVDPDTFPTQFLLEIGVGAEVLVGCSVDATRATTPQALILSR